jgi:ABC-type lipoprotein export system ATPase subunit
MLAELQDITKYYEQPGSGIRNVILNQVTLGIDAMDAIAIVGPSGSGKSTLLNMLGTLDKPSGGRVVIDGTPTGGLDDNRLAMIRNQYIGFVFQLHHLLPQLTLLENVLLPALPQKDKLMQKITKDKTTEKLTLERAHYLIERVGLASQVHQRPGQMSVGECQRAAVVRALINQPRLLLADEPTGSLDAENASHLGHLLSELNQEQNLAVVLVTHSIELASMMRKTYKLTSGKLQLIESR